MSLLMEPGQIYNSWDEFKAALDTHSKENKVIFNVANAKTVEQSNAFMKRGPFYDPRLKYSHLVLQCKHYGSYTSTSAGLRPKQRSYKIDCRAFISISACRKKNYLIIRDSYHKHSHPCTEEIYNSYPEVRRMTKDERRMVGTLLDMGVPLSQIKSAVGKNVTPKDLHNAKVHMRAVKMGVKSEEPKSRPAIKRDAFLLKKEQGEEIHVGESISGDNEESLSQAETHIDSQCDTSQKDTTEVASISEQGNLLQSEDNATVSAGTLIEEKPQETGELGEVSNLENPVGPEFTVTSSDDISQDKTSYTVIVSTAEGEKESVELVTGLQELFHKYQSEGLPKNAGHRLPKTKVLDQIQMQEQTVQRTSGAEEKNCENCGKYMSPLDYHSLCLLCLGPQHLHKQDCEYCNMMTSKQLNIRRKLLVRMRMKALKDLNESKRLLNNYTTVSVGTRSTDDPSIFQPRKSKRVRKPKDFGPDISVQNIFSNKAVSSPKVTKCVVNDGEKEYMVEIPKREPDDAYAEFSSETEPSSHLPPHSQNTERFNHLLKQTAVFEDVVLKNNEIGEFSYEPDVSSVLEMNKAMSHSIIQSVPKGVEGKYALDSQFEASYCSIPSSLDVPGDKVLNTMSNGLHKLAENATVQTRLAIYDKLFTRLGVGMADEALNILSQLYGKVTHVTEISQEDLTNDLQTALDTIQALKDVLEELGLMSKDALSTASHQRSISVHSLDKAKKALKRPLQLEETSPVNKRRKFEPFTKQRLTTQVVSSESESVRHSFTSDPSQTKLEVDDTDSNDKELKHHIVMEVSSLPSEISSSVLAPYMTVPQVAISSELLERLQNEKDGIIELNVTKGEETFSSDNVDTTVEVHEVMQAEPETHVHVTEES